VRLLEQNKRQIRSEMNLKIKTIVTLKAKKQKLIPMLLMLAQKKMLLNFPLHVFRKKES
jgi:hypothetical protein